MLAVAALRPSQDALAPIVAAVDTHLHRFLTGEERHWRDVDPWLAEPFFQLRDFLLHGGKRLRPAFCVCGFLGAGGELPQPSVLDAASALELLHAFALIHDDVMDASDTRRGRPALHRRLTEEHHRARLRGDGVRFGEGMAVLVGDLAFACADRLISSAPAVARGVWNDLRAELVMGQYLDMLGAARGSMDTVRSLRIAQYKTASYTIERPLHLGAALGGRLAELAEPYSAFGRPLGEAFQLRDDLLGALGDDQVTGKPVGDDFRQGKPTVLLSVARERAGKPGQSLLHRVGAAPLSDDDIDALRRLLVDCGARDAIERMIEVRHAEALDALAVAPIDDAVRNALASLAVRTLWRQD